MTDFDIHIQDSTETFQAKENLRASSVELIKSGQADPSMIVNIMTARNVTELRSYIDDAVKNQKQENNIVAQLKQQAEQSQQQVQELSKQLNQLQTENENLQKQLEKNSDKKLEIERQRVAIEEQEMRNKKEYDDRIAKAKERQVDIEFLQMNDGNPYNDKVKDV